MRLSAPPRPQPLPDLPPHLQLRPHFTRPLQWWNPLDSLRLLYWVFFKPQFIRDYVEYLAPGAAEAQGKEAWNLLRQQPALRNFALHALLLEILVPLGLVGLAWLLQQAGLPIDWRYAAVGVALGVAFGVTSTVGLASKISDLDEKSSVGGYVDSMVLGLGLGALGGALGIVGGIGVRAEIAFVMALVGFGIVLGVYGSVARGMDGGVAVHVVRLVLDGVLLCMVLGMMLGMIDLGEGDRGVTEFITHLTQ
jgi:hypothetical protein